MRQEGLEAPHHLPPHAASFGGSHLLPLAKGTFDAGSHEEREIFAPDTAHVPTVTGGRMLIVYFLPGGEVEWINEGKA